MSFVELDHFQHFSLSLFLSFPLPFRLNSYLFTCIGVSRPWNQATYGHQRKITKKGNVSEIDQPPPSYSSARPREYHRNNIIPLALALFSFPRPFFFSLHSPSEVCRVLFRLLLHNAIQNFPPLSMCENIFFLHFPFLSPSLDNSALTLANFKVLHIFAVSANSEISQPEV